MSESLQKKLDGRWIIYDDKGGETWNTRKLRIGTPSFERLGKNFLLSTRKNAECVWQCFKSHAKIGHNQGCKLEWRVGQHWLFGALSSRAPQIFFTTAMGQVWWNNKNVMIRCKVNFPPWFDWRNLNFFKYMENRQGRCYCYPTGFPSFAIIRTANTPCLLSKQSFGCVSP